MKHEFTKIIKGVETRYVLENATAGGTSSGSVASVSTAMGGVRKRGDNLLAQEAGKKEAPKPRNFVAKNAKMGGAGQHKDKKKAEKQGNVKHKKPFAEEQGVAEGSIKDAESALARHGQRKVDHEQKYGPMSGADLHQHEVMRKQLLDKKRRAQNAYAKKQGVAEAGPFSYGAKKPRKGSIAANAEQKRKEQDNGKQPIEPRDQMVGVAKVKQGVTEGMDGAVNYTLDHPVDKEYVYQIVSDGRGRGIYNSLEQAKDIVKNMKNISSNNSFKIVRKMRSKMAGPKGQLPEQGVAEEWSQKYKSSINCSHPKGFSQKAHCAGKKKHEESMMTMEAVCPDCGMCQTHGNLNEIKKGAKDSNGYTKCWSGYHAAGTKKGKNGGQVRNCVPNESVAEGMDPEKRARLDDLLGMYRDSTDPSDYYDSEYEDPEEVLNMIRAEFGNRVADQIEAGTDKMHFPRKDHDQGYDPMSWRKPIDRQTKAGKMYKQDSDYRKNTIKSRYRLSGKSATEGVNGEYDDEAGMAHNNLLTSARAVMGLLKTIEDKDNLPEWVQEKIAKAEMMLVGVWDYLQSQKEQGIDPKVEGYGRYDRRDAYQRDYDHSVAGMDRPGNHRDDERHDLDPTDWYVVKDGKMFKVSVYPNQEQEAMARGYSRTREEAKAKADDVLEVAPPGWEKTVKAMKKHDNIDNPFALAWSMKNKGYKSHKKESDDPYLESLASKLDQLKKK